MINYSDTRYPASAVNKFIALPILQEVISENWIIFCLILRN